MKVKIDSSWKKYLTSEFEKPYFVELTEFVKREYMREPVYPAPGNIFRAFDLCPFEKVKVVILGQDPYHGQGQANGLCFAVNEGINIPPSLQNIFKEIESDLGTPTTKREKWEGQTFPKVSTSTKWEGLTFPKGGGDLSGWAKQGVLLLNATLTVRAHIAGSHQGKGWEEFTDAAVRALSDEREHLVFMLWGNYAKQKGAHIDREKHFVLEAAHPSPFSAYNGFFGCKHFSKANEYLRAHNVPSIDWL